VTKLLLQSQEEPDWRQTKEKENDRQRNPKEKYIGQNVGKEGIDLVVELNEAPRKEEDKKLYLILEKAKSKWLAQPNKYQIKDDKKRRCWHSKLSAKEEKMIKGYALPMEGMKYDWHD